MRTYSLLFLAVPVVLLGACTPSNTYQSGTSSSVSSPESEQNEYGSQNAQEDQNEYASSSADAVPASAMPTPTPVAKEPTAMSVSIQNFKFSQSNITVKQGTTVTWTNEDSAAHTVTGDSGGPNSQSLSTGQSYSFTFTMPGTFTYHCSIHPSMTGTVTVKP